MNNQKNRFWTFCFSLVPGAGEMYFGLYRQGISLMLAFFVLLMVPMMLGVGLLSLLAVILWFYSFLHVHNLRAMTPEAFGQLEDKYIWEDGKINFKWKAKHKNWVGIGLVIVGIYLLWNSVLSWLNWILPDIFGYLVPPPASGRHRRYHHLAGHQAHHRQKAGAGRGGDRGRARRRDRLHRHPGVPQRVHRS